MARNTFFEKKKVSPKLSIGSKNQFWNYESKIECFWQTRTSLSSLLFIHLFCYCFLFKKERLDLLKNSGFLVFRIGGWILCSIRISNCQKNLLTVFWGEGLERYLSRMWNSSLLSARAALLIILSCGSLVDDNCNKGLGPPVLKGLGPNDLSSEGPPMPPEALKLLLFEVLFLCSWLSTLVDPADALVSWVSNMSGHVQEWAWPWPLQEPHPAFTQQRTLIKDTKI